MRLQTLLLALFGSHMLGAATSNTSFGDFENYLIAVMFPELESVLFPVQITQNSIEEDEQRVVVKQEPMDVEVPIKCEPEDHFSPGDVYVNEPAFIIIKGEVPPFVAVPIKTEPVDTYCPAEEIKDTETSDCFNGLPLLNQAIAPPVLEEQDDPAHHSLPLDLKPIATPLALQFSFSSSSFSSSSSDSDSSSSFEVDSRKRPAEGRGRSHSPKRRRVMRSPSPRRKLRSPSPQSYQRRRSPSPGQSYSSRIHPFNNRYLSKDSDSYRAFSRERSPRLSSHRNTHRSLLYDTKIVHESELYYRHNYRSNSRIAIYCVRAETQPEVIYDWCRPFGPIKDMLFLREKRNSTRHVAFVEFEDVRDAERALETLHDTVQGKQRIGVIFCELEYSRYSRIVRVMVPNGSYIPRHVIESVINNRYLNDHFGSTLNSFYNEALKVGFVTFASEAAALRAIDGLRRKGFIASRRCDLENLSTTRNK